MILVDEYGQVHYIKLSKKEETQYISSLAPTASLNDKLKLTTLPRITPGVTPNSSPYDQLIGKVYFVSLLQPTVSTGYVPTPAPSVSIPRPSALKVTAPPSALKVSRPSAIQPTIHKPPPFSLTKATGVTRTMPPEEEISSGEEEEGLYIEEGESGEESEGSEIGSEEEQYYKEGYSSE